MQRNLVVVDDSFTVAQLFAAYLEPLTDRAPKIFTSPVDALLWCKVNIPDLVLLDYRMPEMNGISFLHQFYSVPELAETPVVMVTSEEGMSTLYEALEAGATDFLRKPVDRAELLARARNMLELRDRYLKLKAANDALLMLATTDSLTGLRNRRYFIERMDGLVRDGQPFTLLLADADRFKEINDTYGHCVGDRVLMDLAHVLGQFTSSGGCAGRLGGEEFGLIIPGATLAEGESLGERILARVRQSRIEVQNAGQVGYTLSLGVTEMARRGDTVSSILRRADIALYAAKSNGRDRLEVVAAGAPERDLDMPSDGQADPRRADRREVRSAAGAAAKG